MSKISKVGSVPASSIDSLSKRFGNEPVFLLKTFEKEEYAEEARTGKFYANSIDWFRKNGGEGQKDIHESVIRNLYYLSTADGEELQIGNMKPYFTDTMLEEKDNTIKHFSLVCFYAIFLEDCSVIRLNNGDDLIYLNTEDYFKNFGGHVCLYEFNDVKRAIDEIKVIYEEIDFGKVKYSDLLSDKCENGSVTLDKEFYDELFNRYRYPYFFKSLEFNYQKEWRIIYPYEFSNEKERYVELKLVGGRRSLPREEIIKIGDTEGMLLGFLASMLVPDYISPFMD